MSSTFLNASLMTIVAFAAIIFLFKHAFRYTLRMFMIITLGVYLISVGLCYVIHLRHVMAQGVFTTNFYGGTSFWEWDTHHMGMLEILLRTIGDLVQFLLWLLLAMFMGFYYAPAAWTYSLGLVIGGWITGRSEFFSLAGKCAIAPVLPSIGFLVVFVIAAFVFDFISNLFSSRHFEWILIIFKRK